jgi:hypothetical protein
MTYIHLFTNGKERKPMFSSPDGKMVEVRDRDEVRLFETHWWKLYWQRTNPEKMPAQFNWIAKGKPQYPREVTVEKRS